MNNKITIIIPYLNELDSLSSILMDVPQWTKYPNTILIVNTNTSELSIDKNILASLNNLSVKIKIIDCPNAFPGRARNQGLNFANDEYVAFLDTQTKPEKIWLNDGINLLNKSDVSIVWGSTEFSANSYFEKAIRASTYGKKPLRTLPGTILRSRVIPVIGHFIENVRAGEDADWMRRAETHNLSTTSNFSLLEYSGLEGIKLKSLIKKWYRNYHSAANLPYIRAHKDIYFYFISIFLILLAFNWNSLSYDSNISGWNISALVYLPNITKIMTGTIGLVYILFRIIYLPLKKGVGAQFFFNPFNFFIVLTISFILDITKFIAFIHARISKICK
jgi:glycosyltransferase involved in cell wall biosynthesis